MWGKFSPTPQEFLSEWRLTVILMHESFEEGLKCVENGQEFPQWIRYGEHQTKMACDTISMGSHGTSRRPISTEI